MCTHLQNDIADPYYLQASFFSWNQGRAQKNVLISAAVSTEGSHSLTFFAAASSGFALAWKCGRMERWQLLFPRRQDTPPHYFKGSTPYFRVPYPSLGEPSLLRRGPAVTRRTCPRHLDCPISPPGSNERGQDHTCGLTTTLATDFCWAGGILRAVLQSEKKKQKA